MRLLFILFLILCVVIGAVFQIGNPEIIEIHFFLGSIELSIAKAITIATLFGTLLGFGFSLFIIMRLKLQNRQLSRDKEISSQELSNLRNIPIQE